MDLQRLQEAIREEDLDGWLFFNFRHRDPIADRLIGVPADGMNTRGWYYMVPACGEPLRIVHAIEANVLVSAPGRQVVYASRAELIDFLGRFRGQRLAAQFSPELPIVSYLDHGTALFLSSLGLHLVSSAALVQRAFALLTVEDIRSHEQSTEQLYEIVHATWRRLSESLRSRSPTTEGAVQRWMIRELERRGLVADHPPIVAAGRNTANPHYSPQGPGAPVGEGDVVQFDIWAKQPGGIYADISWVGIAAEAPPESVRRVFRAAVGAREGAIRFIRESCSSGEPPSGMAVDREVRSLIVACGFEQGLRHRTGHAIDTAEHGSGVNLDSVEFPDPRLLLDGSLFSVEPGIYLNDFGVRTEINAYMKSGVPVVTGPGAQTELLTLASP